MWRRRRGDRLARELRVVWEQRDPTEVASILHRDVELVVDGGADLSAGGRLVRGAGEVAAALVELLPPEGVLAVVGVNGSPGVVMRRDGRVVGVLCLATRRQRIDRLWMVTAPAKLGHWNIT